MSSTTKPGETTITSNRPPASKFKQQSIPAFQPIYSPRWVISALGIAAVVFLALGGSILVASDNVLEVTQRYDHQMDPKCNGTTSPPDYGCTNNVAFTVSKKMTAPVFMYYRLTNFYQNHRKYAKSKSEKQLVGNEASSTDLSDCDPFDKPGEYDLTYNPCGLIAWSMFNDSFVLKNSQGTVLCDGSAFSTETNEPTKKTSCTKKGIAWSADVDVKFKAPHESPTTLTHKGLSDAKFSNISYIKNGWYRNEDHHAIPNPLDEDFMVWMRVEPTSTFIKLYRRIDVDLPEGEYTMTVTQRFPVSAFEGTKSFVLLKPTWIGGPNRALAGFYLTVGSLLFVFAVTFLLKVLFPTRDPMSAM